jgi:hypothetical protein
MNCVNLEQLRESYKPETVRCLFIGESPPAGGTFFYAGDSLLARYTQRAFEASYGALFPAPEQFLAAFAAAGCYLDDLCLHPVNRLPTIERRHARDAGVGPLAQRIGRLSPKAFVSFPRAIRKHTRKALELVGLASLPCRYVPFPNMSHQGRYVEELTEWLSTLRRGHILPNALSPVR